MARTTVDIKDLKAQINGTLLHSFDADRSARLAVSMLLAGVLQNAGQYKGFNYLTPDMMKKSLNGKSIGVDHNKPEGTRFEGTDETRIFYY